MPLYKRVAGRRDNTVFVPKQRNVTEEFIKTLDLNKEVIICEDQEKKWSKQLSRMIDAIHADLKKDQHATEEMTFEQMLKSEDFFSFEAFNQCKKLSE